MLLCAKLNISFFLHHFDDRVNANPGDKPRIADFFLEMRAAYHQVHKETNFTHLCMNLTAAPQIHTHTMFLFLIPEKVGLKAVQRDGLDFEFTLVFDVDIKHFAVASKDRTEIFMDKPEFKISIETSKKILDWCNSGKQDTPDNPKELSEQEVYSEIQMCNSVSELLALYKKYPQYQENLKPYFEVKKSLLIQLTNPQNLNQNGHAKHY